jgi:hypothetical protein
MAEESIDGGGALQKLKRLAEFTSIAAKRAIS